MNADVKSTKSMDLMDFKSRAVCINFNWFSLPFFAAKERFQLIYGLNRVHVIVFFYNITPCNKLTCV